MAAPVARPSGAGKLARRATRCGGSGDACLGEVDQSHRHAVAAQQPRLAGGDDHVARLQALEDLDLAGQAQADPGPQTLGELLPSAPSTT